MDAVAESGMRSTNVVVDDISEKLLIVSWKFWNSRNFQNSGINEAKQVSSDGVMIRLTESKGTNLHVKTCLDKYHKKRYFQKCLFIWTNCLTLICVGEGGGG